MVFDPLIFWAKAANASKCIRPHHAGRLKKTRPATQQVLDDRIMVLCKCLKTKWFGIDIYFENGTTDCNMFQMGSHEIHLVGQSVRHRNIIGIHAANQIRDCRFMRSVCCRNHAAVRLMDDNNPWVAFGKPVQHLGALVRATIINANQLPVLKRLVNDTANGCNQVFSSIVNGQNNGNGWFTHIGDGPHEAKAMARMNR